MAMNSLLSPTEIADSPLTTTRSRIDPAKVEELSTGAADLATRQADLAREVERLSVDGAHSARLLYAFTPGGVRHAAVAAGIAEKRFAHILNGSAIPDLDEVRAICKALTEIAQS